MATKQQYHDNAANSSSTIFRSVSANRHAAQSFTTTDSYTISSVKILIYRFGLPENFTVSIREVSGDDPTGGDLAVGTFNGDDITEDTGGEWKEVTFNTPYELTESTKYTIYIRNEGTPHGVGPALYWLGVSGSSSYPNGAGRYSFNGGVGWSSASKDFNFETWDSGASTYKVINPGPEDDETDVNRVTNLTWEAGEETADDYDVWFGTPGNMVLVGTQVSNLYFNIADYTGGLALDTEYEWRVDSYVNSELVATGDVWSYTTRAQRTVVLSSPTNTDTGILLQPLLDWAISGIGAQYGSYEDQDYLFVYLKKDDANFTEDNLISNFLEAVLNSDLQIVAGLEYGATYYWQVQAGNTASDLADSEVWSFTVLDFLPPAHSTREKLVYGEPGGPGDPEGDPGDPDTREYETIPSGENNMLTARRLIVAAKNKIFYEDI